MGSTAIRQHLDAYDKKVINQQACTIGPDCEVHMIGQAIGAVTDATHDMFEYPASEHVNYRR